MEGQYDWSGNLQHVPHFSTGKVEEWSDSAGNIPRRKQDKGYQKFLDGFVHNIEGNWRFSFLFVNPDCVPIQLLITLSKCTDIYKYIWCTLVHVKSLVLILVFVGI